MGGSGDFLWKSMLVEQAGIFLVWLRDLVPCKMEDAFSEDMVLEGKVRCVSDGVLKGRGINSINEFAVVHNSSLVAVS